MDSGITKQRFVTVTGPSSIPYEAAKIRESLKILSHLLFFKGIGSRIGEGSGVDSIFKEGYLEAYDSLLSAASPLPTVELYLSGEEGASFHPLFTSYLINPAVTEEHLWNEAAELYRSVTSSWFELTWAEKRCCVRGVFKLYGRHLCSPSIAVICWIKNTESLWTDTYHMLRLARSIGIPVFNLAIEGDLQRLLTFIDTLD